MSKAGRLLVTLALSLSPLFAHGASFNCEKAASVSEKLICATPDISVQDEQYAQLYSAVRKAAKPSPEFLQQVKLDARAALRQRESMCRDSQCLRLWYNKGLTRLSQQLTMAQYVHVKPSPKTLYEKLDLNTFSNGLRKNLTFTERKYLTEYYDLSVVDFEPNTLKIDAPGEAWTINILDDATLEIIHRLKRGSYYTAEVVSIYFDGKDFVSAGPTGGFFDVATQQYHFSEDANVHCALLGYKQDAYAQRLKTDQRSSGEILVGVQFSPSTISLFDKPNGREVGEMRLVGSKVNAIGTYDPDIRLCNHNSRVLFKTPIYYRHQDDALLLVFENQGNWLNLSDDPAVPAWFKLTDLPDSLSNRFVAR